MEVLRGAVIETDELLQLAFVRFGRLPADRIEVWILFLKF